VGIRNAIVHDANADFLNNDDDIEFDLDLYLTTSFACGIAFSVGVLDSLVTSTYYNDGLLSFLSVFVNGGVTHELEALLADEVGVGYIG
jgi:hypothetical protein